MILNEIKIACLIDQTTLSGSFCSLFIITVVWTPSVAQPRQVYHPVMRRAILPCEMTKYSEHSLTERWRLRRRFACSGLENSTIGARFQSYQCTFLRLTSDLCSKHHGCCIKSFKMIQIFCPTGLNDLVKLIRPFHWAMLWAFRLS